MTLVWQVASEAAVCITEYRKVQQTHESTEQALMNNEPNRMLSTYHPRTTYDETSLAVYDDSIILYVSVALPLL
jgi:hypothetical protein